MVPEKTCAAREETSEEQGSGKAPVRERWRGQKGGEQPPQAQGRGVCGTAGRCTTYFCAVTRCSDSLSEWRVCVWGGSGQQLVLPVCPETVWFMVLMLCLATLFSFAAANAGGEWFC